MKSLFFTMVIFVFSIQSYADQCAWNNRAPADRARNAILSLANINQTEKLFILEHCTHCSPHDPRKAYKVSIDKASGPDKKVHNRSDNYQIKVALIKSPWSDEKYYGLNVYDADGKLVNDSVDLAYAYVKTAPGVFASLAYMANCQLAVQEPAFIYIPEQKWESFRDSDSMKEIEVSGHPSLSIRMTDDEDDDYEYDSRDSFGYPES
ncbi:MAG: hypothetical protein KDD50_03245 [Bdellovibrionales bacterium]|nr:hypothetical protein [Bdellovibrionales bacterium]